MAALGSLAHEHGADAKAHDEEAAEAVEQISAALELGAVRIDDGDGDDADEAIEGVECREHCLVAVDHDDAQDDLDEHGELCEGGVPPQGAGAKGDEFVGGQSPDAGEGVADDDDPGPVVVEVVESLGVHRETNLPHRGGGFIAGVVEGEGVVSAYVKSGDGTVVEVGNHQLGVVGDVADDGVDGNEVAEDDGVVFEVCYEVRDGVLVVDKLLAKLLPGAGHGLLQPGAALIERDVAGCGDFGDFGMDADWGVLCFGKWLGGLLAAQQWA